MYVFKSIGAYYLLFDGILPIDLIINLMISKTFYTFFMENDIHMVCYESSIEEGRIIGCNVKNTLLIEDFA